jgi:hypothetical protein
MKDGYKLDYIPDMPEEIGLTVETTGPMGGDAGHGGWTYVEFYNDSDVLQVEVENRHGQFQSVDASKVRITVLGDWETHSMLDGLSKIGLRVMLAESATFHQMREEAYDKVQQTRTRH